MRHVLPIRVVVFALVFIPVAALCDDKTPAKMAPFTDRVKGTLVRFEMVPIKGGRLLFSPDGKEPPKEVEIKPFFMSKTETTWDQYETWYLQLDLPEKDRKLGKDSDAITRPSPPHGAPSHSWGTNKFPVLHSSYNAAEKYCLWLSQKTGRNYRLPTEAEWEYACSAGEENPPDKKAVPDYAWCKQNSANPDFQDDPTTHEVATKKPNAFGLYDMLGNVGEWCIPMAGKEKIIRGGTYLDNAKDISWRTRTAYSKDWQMNDSQDPKSKWWMSDGPFCGFRVICEP